MQLSHLKCGHVEQRSGQSASRFVPLQPQQVHTSSPILVIMLALLKPLTWCSWGDNAGRRPKEELGDGPAKLPPASGRGSVENPRAEASLYISPGILHSLHLALSHTGHFSAISDMRFGPPH